MGTRPDLEPVDGVDAYAFTHNETSTGVMMDPVRVGGVTHSCSSTQRRRQAA